MFFVIMWVAATVNFIGPRLSGTDPIRQMLIQQSLSGGYIHKGLEEMVKVYDHKFGLDTPWYLQYLNYLSQVAGFHFGYSITHYPDTVKELISRGLPWSIGLVGTTTVLAFLLGTLLGAIISWPRAPGFLQYLLPPLLTLSAMPYYILGLVLLYIFAFQTNLLPIFGGYSAGVIPSMTFSFWLDVLRHSILPSLSILLAALGFWALGMRAMMVTTEGEDYMIFAEAKGLKDRTLFLRYAIRNALLPQVTSLALSLGYIVTGSILVEIVFGYPGVGSILYEAITEFDYPTIQGIVFLIIVSIGLTTLIVDIVYPLLDPRISYQRR